MSRDNYAREVPDRKGTTGNNSFDALAKGMASGNITRVQALKLLGVAILSAMPSLSFFPTRASAQEGCDPDQVLCGSDCCDPANCCSGTCCGPTEECCGATCCGPTEECCSGTCCEMGKVCDATSGLCVCPPERIACGSDCCNPIVEICGEDGQCHNPFCESCQAEGNTQCCQVVANGVLLSEACCGAGESMCHREGEGCLCCPSGTRCPDENLGEGFVCVTL
jgi:hypothetical protein